MILWKYEGQLFGFILISREIEILQHISQTILSDSVSAEANASHQN